jgi:hypothetical protein
MQSVLKIVAALALLVGLGIAHGRLSDRWGIPVEVQKTAERVNLVPAGIHGWTSEEIEVNARAFDAAGAAGMLKRLYRNPDTGRSVQVMAICGRPGPVSLHPPTVCFVQSGMQQREREQRTTITVDGREHEFFVGDFKAPGVLGEWQRTYWAWSTDTQTWHAPKDARMEYAGQPLLYKLYLTTPIDIGADEATVETDPDAVKFMEEFLRAMAKYVEPAAATGSAKK